MSEKYFENKDCKFYPCHGLESTNCLFCYCPLYSKEDCLGTPVFLKNGIKDCSNCTFPHKEENYEKLIEALKK